MKNTINNFQRITHYGEKKNNNKKTPEYLLYFVCNVSAINHFKVARIGKTTCLKLSEQQQMRLRALVICQWNMFEKEYANLSLNF